MNTLLKDLPNMIIRFKTKFILLGVLFFILASCSETDQGFSNLFPYSKPSFYFKNSENITIEVYYEPDAEPFEGNIGPNIPLWNITEDNIRQLFSYKSLPPQIFLPKTLNEMNLLTAQNRSSWTVDDVINLYKKNHELSSTKTSPIFYIYFLKGFSSSGQNVIGFSINITPVIAIFKDVINTSAVLLPVRKFIEQSTIVHELGHAFGLVNNGVPLVSSHQDTDHGSHTTNNECVMYWLNEGAESLELFIDKYRNDPTSLTMWGPEVLLDAEAFSD